MKFASERKLEAYIRGLIKRHITRATPSTYALNNKKAVDIVVCRDGPSPALFFIEVKYHQLSHGRLGFGGRGGVGFQPEIVARRPAYFEHNLRWLLASEAHQSKGVIFCDTKTVRNFVSGGAVGGKHNNIRQRIFHDVRMLSEPELIAALQNWLGVSATNATHRRRSIG